MSQSHIGGVSRREFLAKVAAGGAGALMSFAGPVIEKAYGAGPCSGHLTDIEHFVFFMQENRSFDHYFGTLSGTDGFNTVSPLFQQKGWNPMTQALDATGVTMPYRFDTTRGPFLDGACVNDLTIAGWRCMSRGMVASTTTGYQRRPRLARRPTLPR